MRRSSVGILRLLRIPALAIATVGLMYLAWMGLDGSVVAYEPQRLPVLADDTLGGRILVVSPHPDDETLGSGGLITQSLAAGKKVRIVIVTCGDGFRRIAPKARPSTTSQPPFIRLGESRASESRAALTSLGLPAADVVFLGYPDGSLASLWNSPWDPSHPRLGTNGKTMVPYSFALRPGAPYVGSSIASDLAAVVASFSPSAVVFPDAEDANADHSAVNAFTQYVLDRDGYRGARYTYLMHRGHFPFPWSYLPRGWLEPPKSLRSLGELWLAYSLTPATEIAKERALDSYATQRSAMEPFLGAFVRRNELFGASPVAPVAHIGSTASLDATAMPGTRIADPVGDTMMRLLSGEADIRRVALASGASGMWVGVETRTPVTRVVTYHVRATLFATGTAPAVLDVSAHGARAIVVTDARGSITTSAAEVRRRGDRVWILLSPAAFQGARTCMFQGETLIGATVFDRTAWRTIALP